TPDGRYVVVDGRRWRATDPGIPEPLRAELVAELMAARRLVRTDPDAARPRVHDAKVALGERGEPWWQASSPAGRRARVAAVIRALLSHRDGTICPSEAARVVGGAGWRELMPLVREVAWELTDEGVVEVRRRGERVSDRNSPGPIRLARRSDRPG
ncbi:MAG: DUF3253 domain-containing protein, partial [Dermatophilaceae bacterium]